MLGESLPSQGITEVYGKESKRHFVKAPAFSFAKIKGVDSYLSPEMKSTGEAIGYDDSLTRAYIEANRANLYGGWLAERLSRKVSIAQARELFDVLSLGVQRTDAVAPLRERVERDERSQKGCRVEGLPDEVNSQLQADKYVLIDFWASWNHDSKARARKLAKLTESLDGTKIAICRISMDNSREQWLSAIEGEPSWWTQFNGMVYDLAIESLPVSYMINPHGKIVMRAESIEELEQGINELF